MAQVIHQHMDLDDSQHPVLHWIAALCLSILAATAFYFAVSSTDTVAVESGPGIKETVKNPEESGPARITYDNPKIAPTTGTDVKGDDKCRTVTLRRNDGGITKVRRCAE